MKIKIFFTICILGLIMLSFSSGSNNDYSDYFIMQEKVYVYLDVTLQNEDLKMTFLKFIKQDKDDYLVKVYNYNYERIVEFTITNTKEKLLLNSYIEYKDGKIHQAKIYNNLLFDKIKYESKLSIKYHDKKFKFYYNDHYTKTTMKNIDTLFLYFKTKERPNFLYNISFAKNIGLFVISNFSGNGKAEIAFSGQGTFTYEEFNKYIEIYNKYRYKLLEIPQDIKDKYGVK